MSTIICVTNALLGLVQLVLVVGHVPIVLVIIVLFLVFELLEGDNSPG